ncbi:MAG TPA: VOC family protein [Ilumatobacter sp.]|nr:VOC family protein [Ilumatobacter sp.]
MTTDTSNPSGSTTGTGVAALSGIVLDCANPPALAQFYSDLTGWPVYDGSSDEWATIEAPFGVALAFQGVDDYVAPSWPGTEPPQQFHLDFDVPDLDAGEAQVLALGARKAEHQPGESFRVYLDPEGHPFCLCLAG